MCTSPYIKKVAGINDGKFILRDLNSFERHCSIDEIVSMYDSNELIFLPCGKCEECRISYRRDWATRCIMEASTSKKSYFITFTYNDDNLPCDLKLKKDDLLKFFKDLRNRRQSIKYLACGEYGSLNHRPHYHAIIFNLEVDDFQPLGDNKGFSSKFLSNLWKKGFIYISTMNEATANYVAGYTTKKIGHGDEFLIFSKCLGKNYALNNIEKLKQDNGIYVNGSFRPLPRYIKNVVFKDLSVFDKWRAMSLAFDRQKFLNNLERMINDNKKGDLIACYNERVKINKLHKKVRNLKV